MPRRINHVNRFFKELKRLEEASRTPWGGDLTDEDGVRPYYSLSHEAHEADCTKRPDGLWETKPEWYGNQYKRKFIFLWRIHPNYNVRGKPYYSHEDAMEFKRNSETEKVLYEYDGYEFVIGWSEVTMPTWCIWGMGMGEQLYFLRKDGKVLTEPTSVKKYFREDVEHELEKKNAKV